MKKICSILLSAVILCGTFLSVPVFAKTDDTALHFAVATDIHYVTPLPNTTDTVKDVKGPHRFNTATGEQTAPSGFIIDAFLKQCAENEDCDFVLISGDLATYGRTFVSEHEALAEKFRAFEKETGKQIYVINGNHDNGSKDNADHNTFIEIYHEFGYDDAFSTDEGTCSYSVLLSDKYMLIALDSFDEDYALVSKLDSHRLSWVRKQAAYARKTGREPILMLHHHILEHDPFQAIASSSYIVKTPYTVSGLLADMGIRLAFTGHFHMNDVTSYTSLLGNTIYDFAQPSLANYPAEYKIFTVSETEVNYRTQKVQSIDADALSKVCKGFSAEDLTLMKTDFAKYLENKEYNSLANGLTATFTPDTKNAFIRTVSDNLRAMLDTPLYGENSLQEMAKPYGVNIPESAFTSIRDLLANLYMTHTNGQKIFNPGSVEMDVFLKTMAFAVHKSASTAMDAKTEKELADKLLKTYGETFGALTTAEQAAAYIACDLFGKYFADMDGIDNCNGTIPGAKTQKIAVSTVLRTILYTIRRFFEIPLRSIFRK